MAGTAVMGVAGAFHPLPAGDAMARLATIAATPHWSLVHASLLAGQLLTLTGYMALAAWLDGTDQQIYLRPGAGAVIFGVTLVSINILFMAGAGPSLAGMQARGEAQAVMLFDALHPWGLAAQRLGGAALGLGLALYGVAVARGGRLPPRLGWLGAGFGVAWVLLALGFQGESLPFLAGFVLAGAWQALLGAWLVTKTQAAP